MQTVTLRAVTLGEGIPKICVPLVGRTIDALRQGAGALTPSDYDVVELRIDFLDEVDSPAAVRDAIAAVRDALPSTAPLLFTFRTLQEGGNRAIAADAYAALIALAVATGQVDAVDVEMFSDPTQLPRIVADAHAHGIKVVMSSHDFGKTPPRDEIIARLEAQQALGADVVKIAVMPRSARDVVTLIDATEAFTSGDARPPAITMSMGGLGAVSRLTGETFGSCLTFGAVGTASAPGQVAADQLRSVLRIVHDAR
jgi:3-dehydroquinate dehydratase I